MPMHPRMAPIKVHIVMKTTIATTLTPDDFPDKNLPDNLTYMVLRHNMVIRANEFVSSFEVAEIRLSVENIELPLNTIMPIRRANTDPITRMIHFRNRDDIAVVSLLSL